MSPGSSESCSRILPRSTFETSTPGHSGWSEKVELPQTSRKTWVMRTKFLDDNRIFVVWVDVLFTLGNVCICMYIMYIYIYILYVPLFGEESDRRLISGSVEYFWRGTSGSDICNFLGFGVQICLYPSTTSGNLKWKFTRPICESIYYFWGGKEGAASFTCQIPPPHFETNLLEVYRTWMGALPT